jgi:hypothetical protein
MTATAPDQVAFMRSAGLPLSAEVRKTFTAVPCDQPRQLNCGGLVDDLEKADPETVSAAIYRGVRATGGISWGESAK